MAQKTRIYLVHTNNGQRLVRAAHPAQAINHVARSSMTVQLASQDDLIDALANDVSVETARGDTDDLPFEKEAA